MKNVIISSALGAGLSMASAVASVPKDPSMNEYRSLLGRSAFIIKKPPVVEAQQPVNNSLKLRGASKVHSGWIVTLYDRKKPNENIILKEGQAANKAGLKLISVKQSKGNYKATTATVLTGGRQVTVKFDDEAIKRSLSKSAATAQKRVNRKRASQNKATVTRAINNNKNQANVPPFARSNANANAKPKTSTSTGRRPRVRRTKPKTQ